MPTFKGDWDLEPMQAGEIRVVKGIVGNYEPFPFEQDGPAGFMEDYIIAFYPHECPVATADHPLEFIIEGWRQMTNEDMTDGIVTLTLKRADNDKNFPGSIIMKQLCRLSELKQKPVLAWERF